ncbi:MAG: hypothetical protein Q7J25_12225 [Vicinamibacterales bacterium]|nr:hypothetical protein [Vicinamibacterales bacterium]
MTTALAEAPTEPVAPPSGSTLAAKTICLVLRGGSFGNARSCNLAAVTVDSDKTLLRMTKTLLDSKELHDVARLDSHVSAYLRSVAFPSMFKSGIHLIPVALVEVAIEKLEEFAERRKALVDLACAAYPQRIIETSARLGVMHQPDDYPSPERFRASFIFEYELVTFETPTRLKAISAELFEKERQKAQIKLSAVATECQQAMRAGLSKLVDHLVERLTPDPITGKPKRFSKAVVGNLNDFLAMFELRDVTDDAELGALVKKARSVMAGVDPKLLGSDELVRQTITTEFAALKTALDPLVLEKGNRVITFEAEDEGV